MTSVVIADDEALIRLALAEVLGAEPELEVTGAAATVDEAVALVERTAPDVLVLDVRMPTGGGAELLKRLGAKPGPRPGLVAFSAYDDPASRDLMHGLGVREYVVKGEPNAAIVAAVRRAALASPDH